MLYHSYLAEEPEISIDVGAQDFLSCRSGTTIRIPAIVRGRPIPKTTWEFEGEAKKSAKVSLIKKIMFHFSAQHPNPIRSLQQ